MPYSVPDPHYEELLLPGVKPIGNVVVDKAHSLANGLIHFWMPQMGLVLNANGAGTLHAVAGELGIICTETVAARYQFTQIVTGVPVIRQADPGQYNGDVGFVGGATITVTDSEPFTIISKIRGSTGGSTIETFGQYNTNGGIWNRRGNYFRFYANGSSFDLGAMTANSGNVTSVFATDGGGASGSNVKAYQHETNEWQTGSGQSTGAIFAVPWSNFQTASDNWNKEYAAFFNRELSNAEIVSFCNSPYQFLIPA